MKDQKELLKKCLVNDIPAIVFQGSDSCAVEILQAAENIYRKNGCSPEFLIDFHENVVENFRAYQLENSIATKLPDLTTSEKEAFYILQEKEEAYFPIHIKDFEQHLKDYGFTRTYENTTSYGKYLLLKEKDYIGITGNNGNYDFAINYSKESNQISYFVFSDDPNYPERIGDYNSLKTCFSDIMSRHPLKEEKNELFTVIENYHQMGYDDISQAAIFVYVGIEVGVPGTLNLFLTDPVEKGGAGIASTISGFVVGTYWFLMLIGRLAGASLGAKVSSKAMLTFTSALGLILVFLAIFSSTGTLVNLPVLQQSATGGLSFGFAEVPINAMYLVLVGLCTSIMWGGIFNLAVEGLGKYLAAASGLFMVLVCGGGILPVIQGWVADVAGFMASYWVIIAALAYLLYYGLVGCKNVNKDIPVE